jgi:hypothetical protein
MEDRGKVGEERMGKRKGREVKWSLLSRFGVFLSCLRNV